MSHVSNLALQIHDLDALDRAVQSLGGTLDRTRKQFAYFLGNTSKCDAVINFPACSYEMGVVKSGDQTNESYSLQTDWWGGHMAKRVGEDAYKLGQAYGIELARKHYESQGFMLQIEAKEDGSLEILATR